MENGDNHRPLKVSADAKEIYATVLLRKKRLFRINLGIDGPCKSRERLWGAQNKNWAACLGTGRYAALKTWVEGRTFGFELSGTAPRQLSEAFHAPTVWEGKKS